MNSDIVKFLRAFRLVVLVGFTIYLIVGGTWVHYLFASVCVLIAALTIWQMWWVRERSE